ncbi:MAG TPA: Xaa-Pro peptidase family protein [Candidatus Dormibacteraeota bacterium]|nr:Xaa-Pro peptidase family protein [Candidatus Dormibacteraeota bacterium]
MADFPEEEYRERQEKTRARMTERGLDVLLVTDPANMNYLTGYDAWSFYVPQAVIVPAAAEPPIWVGRGMDAQSARLTTNLPHDRILAYADDYVEHPVKHPMQYVASVLAECGYARGRIGYESDAYYFSAKNLQVLRQELADATWKDAYLLVSWIRTYKSAREIEVMRQAARIAEQVMRVAIDAVAVGVRECDAAALISEAQIRGTTEFGGQAPANPPSLLSGDNAATPHAAWSDRPFREGTATCLELSGCRLHYHCGISRTVWLGRPPDEMRRLETATREGMEAALAVVKPGALCQDVERAWRETIARHGFSKPSRIGYSIGLNYPPNWADHTASLREGDQTMLEPNMTFHLMLGMWMQGWGYELSETFRVTDSGVELLADFPKQLFVKQ